MGVIACVALFFFPAFLLAPSSKIPASPSPSLVQPTSSSTLTAEATFTPTGVPPARVPSDTPTVTITPSTTPTNSPQPSAGSPLSILLNPQTLRTEGFDSLTDNWYFRNATDGTVYIYKGTNPCLVMDARGGYMIELNSNRSEYGVYPGNAYLITFETQYNAAFDAFMVYPGGEPNTDRYRRLGLGYTDIHLFTGFGIGTHILPANDVTGPLAISDNHWYSMLMAYDRQGNAKFLVWQTDDSGNTTNRISYSGGIEELFWNLVIQVGRGVLFIDRIDVLGFDGFR